MTGALIDYVSMWPAAESQRSWHRSIIQPLATLPEGLAKSETAYVRFPCCSTCCISVRPGFSLAALAQSLLQPRKFTQSAGLLSSSTDCWDPTVP